MDRIADALELLTAQHDEIDALLARLSSTHSTARRAAIVGMLAEKLTLHLAVEQELFYPAVATELSAEVHRELLAEHSEIKRILANLLWLDAEDPTFDATLAALQALLDWHELWQEDQLFETVAEAVPCEVLASLGSELHAWIDRTAAVATAA